MHYRLTYTLLPPQRGDRSKMEWQDIQDIWPRLNWIFDPTNAPASEYYKHHFEYLSLTEGHQTVG